MAKSSPYQVIRGGLVLDVDKETAERSDLLIEGEKIIEVGSPGLAAPEGATEIDAYDRLITPGFVNSHTHGHGALGKGLGDKWTLELLLNANPWASGSFREEDLKLAAELNAAEMVLKGSTAAYDMCFEFPSPSLAGIKALGEGYQAVGVRALIAPMMADMTLYRAIPGLIDALPEPHKARAERMAATDHQTHLAACAKILEDWPFDRNRIMPGLGPTIPLHCSDDFIRGARDLAADYSIGVQMHLAESKVQAVAGMKRYGMTLTAYLESLGLLSDRFTAAHGIWLDDEDLKRLAAHGAGVAHNPASNLRLGSGVAPAREMLDHQLKVGIGTDGSISSDNQNMFEAMRAAAYVSRIASPDPDRWLGAWDVLRMGSVGGAELMGLSGKIGRIAPGCFADLVFLDLANVNFVPFNNAAHQIVNSEDSSAVDTVMIGGRTVLSGRQFTEFDFADLRRRVEQTIARLNAESIGKKEPFEAMAEFVSRHCVGLSCSHYHVERRLPH
ncbi:MAG: amidohydrolase family protein [Pseudomonadota bacterium]